MEGLRNVLDVAVVESGDGDTPAGEQVDVVLLDQLLDVVSAESLIGMHGSRSTVNANIPICLCTWLQSWGEPSSLRVEESVVRMRLMR